MCQRADLPPHDPEGAAHASTTGDHDGPWRTCPACRAELDEMSAALDREETYMRAHQDDSDGPDR